jgi:hypothetical protein
MKELNNFRKFIQENELHEGTWSLGSLREMAATMTQIKGMMRETDPAALLQAFEDLDNIMYNVFGDDGFHDYLGAAKDAVEAGDMDRAKNALGDALGRAMELYKDEEAYRKDRGETGFEFKPRFGLEENDAVLDEILDEEKEEVNEAPAVFAEIDQMVGAIKDQMDPDDAFDSLVSEFEAISGGTRLLHQALKNITLDNNLMEKKDEE